MIFLDFCGFLKIFGFYHAQNFSGRFDTRGSIIALAVPEIHCTCSFCDEEEEEELGILVVGYN